MRAIVKNKTIYVAGHKGMVGSGIIRQLKNDSSNIIITASRDELDLTNQQADGYIVCFIGGRFLGLNSLIMVIGWVAKFVLPKARASFFTVVILTHVCRIKQRSWEAKTTPRVLRDHI
jgi:nucleoside-diphosphate-sugar epimerase